MSGGTSPGAAPGEPLLAVRGEAVLEVEPEIATLGVTVAARDPDRAKTLRRLNDRGAAIDHILTGCAGAIEKVETTAVRVSPQLKSNRAHERVSGYLGVVHSTITMAAFERIGELIAALADQDLTDVTGPWWALRPDSPCIDVPASRLPTRLCAGPATMPRRSAAS